MLSLIVLLFSVFAADAQQNFACPHDFGYYPHEIRCDQYWACENGAARLKTCGNGLAFSDTDPDYLTEDCDYFRNVACSTRPERAPPIPTTHCDYQHGVFADKIDCTKFWSCWDGEESTYSCSTGLAYSPKKGICDWMDKVETCDGRQLAEQVAQDFVCPLPGELVQLRTFSRHASPDDCRQYYICLDGVLRENGCPLGTVFQIGSVDGEGQCADPLEVPGCEDYYGDLDLSLINDEIPLVARGQQQNQNRAPPPREVPQPQGPPLRPRRPPQNAQHQELVIDAATLN